MRASRIVPVFGPPMLLAGLLAGCGAPVQDAAEVASTAAPADAPLYFPPADGPWATVDPGDVGWDAAKLEAALDLAAERRSSGVVVLHRGRIMAERYWPVEDPGPAYANQRQGETAAGHPKEDVASVQKSVVAMLAAIAAERGLLTFDDAVSDHLGAGWTQAPLEQETAVSIRHLLKMTSGLTPQLAYEADPDTRWRYNTPAYHHLLRIIAGAANQSREAVTSDWLTGRIGMHDSGWAPRPWANADIAVGFVTSPRDLARFGLLVQARGTWDGAAVVEDAHAVDEATRPSQDLNPAYGYLWWLNGQSFRLGAAGASRNDGPLIASAPPDLVAAQGALDKKLYVVPSLDLVVTRLGDRGSIEGSSFNDAFWDLLIQAAPHRPDLE